MDETKILEIIRLLGCDKYFVDATSKLSIPFVVSDNLKQLLRKNKNDNNIAKRLLGTSYSVEATRIKKSYFKPKHPNFISVTVDSKGSVGLKYISIDNFKKWLRNYLRANHPKDHDISSFIKSLKKGHTNTYSWKVQRLMKHDVKEAMSVFYEIMPEVIQECKLGKGIGKIFNVTDNGDIEDFVHLMKSFLTGDKDQIELVSGDEIPYYYLGDRYGRSRLGTSGFHGTGLIMDTEDEIYNVGGELNNSCMRHKTCSKAIKFYGDNPNTVSLLILHSVTNPKLVEGRALVWTGIDDKKYIDRIYAVNTTIANTIAGYAREKDFINICDNNAKLLPYDKTLVIKIKVEKWDERELPYFDSLRYLNLQDGILSNFVFTQTKAFTKLNTMRANSFGENYINKKQLVTCCVTKKQIWSNMAVRLTYGKHEDKYCINYMSAYIRYLGVYLTMDEINNTDFVLGVCAKGKTLIPVDDAVICEKIDEFIPKSEALLDDSTGTNEYFLTTEQRWLKESVEVQSNLKNACADENIRYAPLMEHLIGKRFKSSTIIGNGLLIRIEGIGTYLIPFSALKRIKYELQKTEQSAA